MGTNHGNPFNKLTILIQGRCGVLHVIMNSKGVGVGDRDRNNIGAGQSRRDDYRSQEWVRDYSAG